MISSAIIAVIWGHPIYTVIVLAVAFGLFAQVIIRSYRVILWSIAGLIALDTIAAIGVWPLVGVSVVLWSATGVLILAETKLINDPRFYFVTTTSTGAKMTDFLSRVTDVFRLETLLAAPNGPTITKRLDGPDIIRQLEAKIFGQPHAVKEVVEKIVTASAKVKRSKPLGTYLFVGPPGTGKTEFAKQLSNILYGDNTLLLIEMTKYSQAHTVSSLFGASKGYSGADSYGLVTASLLAKKDRVICLDEIEKAHPEVLLGFLNALNDGFVTELSTGEKVSTRDCVFVMTTNANYKQIEDLQGQFVGNSEGLSDAVKKCLNQSFRPEFLDRIDKCFGFKELVPLDKCRLIAADILRSAAEYGLRLEHVEPELLVHVLGESLKRESGARETGRTVLMLAEPGMVKAQQSGARAISVHVRRSDSGAVAVDVKTTA
jgi:hypothetical protein